MDDFFRRMFGMPQDPWGRHGGHPLRREDGWSYNNEEPRDFFDNGYGGRGGMGGGGGGFGPFGGGFPFFGPSPFGEFGNHIDDMFSMVERQFEDMSRSLGHMGPPPLQGPDVYGNRGSARDRMLKNPGYHYQDRDLDDRFSSGNYDGVLSGGPSTHDPNENRLALVPSNPKNDNHHPQMPAGGFWGTSMSVTRIQGADGKMEERRMMQDGTGNKSTTVTRKLGDQSYSTTVKSDREGVKEEIEEFNNMGEGDLDEFRQKWDRRGRVGPARDAPGNQLAIGPAPPNYNQPPPNYNPGMRRNYDPSYDDLYRKFFDS